MNNNSGLLFDLPDGFTNTFYSFTDQDFEGFFTNSFANFFYRYPSSVLFRCGHLGCPHLFYVIFNNAEYFVKCKCDIVLLQRIHFDIFHVPITHIKKEDKW